jgi:uncharacterized protein (DUF433 family)
MDKTNADKTIDSQNRADLDEYNGIKFRTLAAGITTHPFIRGGRPCIAGTGLKVTDIAVQEKFWQLSPAQIAEHFDIKQSQVEDALNYYALHADYIDTDIELDHLNHEQFAESQYGAKTREILSRRESVS